MRKNATMPDVRAVLDRFYSVRLGVSVRDLKPGQVAVAACDRCTYAELGYGYVRLLWIMYFGNRAAISVHPSAVAQAARLAWDRTPDDVLTDAFGTEAAAAVNAALPNVEARAGGIGITFYHPGGATPVNSDGEIRPVTIADGPKWIGRRGEGVYMSATEHPSAQRGEAFGVFLGEDLIAEIITHDPPVADMAHLVAADGIEVAEPYRGRGYGKALLAAWTCEMQKRGRVCTHSTSVNNAASIALARSVGYVEYARTRGITYVPPQDERDTTP
jgi:GNAT superfamily N-acetyltransferase